MRRRFVIRRDAAGEPRLVELDLTATRPAARSPAIIGDIRPYRSMRTGETVAGRAQHREHLRRYGLEEVGNEWAAFTKPAAPPGPAPGEIAGDIRRQLDRDPGERRNEAEGVLREAGYEGPQIDRILKG